LVLAAGHSTFIEIKKKIEIVFLQLEISLF